MSVGRNGAARLAVYAVFSAALCATAAADTITVSKGDDLQAAIDGAADGDTIVVRKGVYGPIALDSRADLVIKGKGKPVIDASSADNGVLLEGCQGVEVSGIVVKDAQVVGILGDQCADVTVSKCIVLDSGDEDIDFESSQRITIDRNVVDGTDDDGIAVSDGSGTQSDDCIITRNKIVEPTGHGIDLRSDDNTVSRNVVTKAGGSGILVRGTSNEVTQNKIGKSGGADLQDTSGGDTNTYVGNKAKTLDPPELPNPKK